MFFYHTWCKDTRVQEQDIKVFFWAFHDILSQTLNEIIVAQKVFNSVNICFKMHLFYQKYLSFCILLVSPIVSSTAVNFVLHNFWECFSLKFYNRENAVCQMCITHE